MKRMLMTHLCLVGLAGLADPPHTHAYKYTLGEKGSCLTVDCTNTTTDCSYPQMKMWLRNESDTYVAEYNGQPFELFLVTSNTSDQVWSEISYESFTNCTGAWLGEKDTYYVGVRGTVYPKTLEAPTAVGNYYAQAAVVHWKNAEHTAAQTNLLTRMFEITAPWKIGEDVRAYTNETGRLIIIGTGAMDDFPSAANVPWDPMTVTSVEIGKGVTKVGANAFAGLAGDVPLLGLTATTWNNSIPAPSGAVSADFDAVQIVDGKAYLGVSVYTNSEVKATGEGWGVATNDVIVVPAPGKQGFFYLMSKPSAPSDRGGAVVTGPTFTPGK